MHSHGVVDGSIIHLVSRMRGGARTAKRTRIHVVSTSFGGDTKIGNGNEGGDKEKGGEVTVTTDVRKEEVGDFKSNHTVLLYFTFIMLLVFLFSFYSFLPSLFDTFLYYFIMYLFSNRFVIYKITSGALANLLNTRSIGEALANFVPSTQLFIFKIKQTIFQYKSVAYFRLRNHQNFVNNSTYNKFKLHKDAINNNNVHTIF